MSDAGEDCPNFLCNDFWAAADFARQGRSDTAEDKAGGPFDPAQEERASFSSAGKLGVRSAVTPR